MMTETKTLSMHRQEVLDYMKEHEITVSLVDSKERDGETIELWGFHGKTGFSTFDTIMTEDDAKYASVLFYRLHNECGVDFGSAERLAQAYVKTYVVMREPMTEKEQEEVRKRLLGCIESGNFGIAGQDGQ
ncbi:MAG TPA: hypothetical protein EYQ21_04700 [Flavobacteriales bacterium]|nr:hypothetical protein [Flavobacteriales bacterium]